MPGEGVDARLGCRIRGPLRLTGERGDRRGVDDRAAAPGEQMRHRVPGDQHVPAQIHGDHAVPHRDQIPQIAPEGLRPPAFEVLEGDALLLHPREVPEVEDPISVEFGELQKMVVRRLEDVSGERPLRGSLVEPCRVVSGEGLVTLRSVHREAVGGDSRQNIVRSESEALPDNVRSHHSTGPGASASQPGSSAQNSSL